MENKNICRICGKEKSSRVIPYINKIIYIDCECEKELLLKIEEEKRQKAIKSYIDMRTKSSHILRKEEKADISTLIIDDNNRRAVDAAKYIIELLLKEDSSKTKNGLILSGNRGSGKTFIAASIINEYNKKQAFNEGVIKEIIKSHENGFLNDLGVKINSNCKYIKEKDVILLYEKYNYRDNTSPIDEFKKAKLLVIDDLGTTYGDSKKIMSILFDLFDYRYSQELSTIITTNLTKEDLIDYLGERTFDRLRCACHFVSLASFESRRS